MRKGSELETYLVERSLQIKAVQVTLDRFSIGGQAGTVEFLLFKTRDFSVVTQRRWVVPRRRVR